MEGRLIRCIALVCLIAPAAAGAQPAQVLEDAERLIRAGRGAEALRLLGPQEAALAGQPLYDYLYGVAAIEAGEARAAIAALARVVAGKRGAP